MALFSNSATQISCMLESCLKSIVAKWNPNIFVAVIKLSNFPLTKRLLLFFVKEFAMICKSFVNSSEYLYESFEAFSLFGGKNSVFSHKL